MTSGDQYWVHFYWKWMRMSAEAASFWFTKGLAVQLCDPTPLPAANQYGIWLTPDAPPFTEAT